MLPPLHHLDILIDEQPGELRTIALSSDDFRIQWHAVPPGALLAMQTMLARPDDEYAELPIGRIFAATVYFTRREGMFGFKVCTADLGDLVRLTLTDELRVQLQDWLADTIPDWGP